MADRPLEIVLSPEADLDIANAYGYYATNSVDLAERFLDDLEFSFERISQLWNTHQVRYKNVKCRPVGAFPYLVHYSVDTEKMEALVHGIYHQKSDTPLNSRGA